MTMSASRLTQILLTSLLVLACGTDRESRDPLTAPTVPVPVISDGANLGNTHFYFLPPLVPLPAYSGTSDGSLSPVVSVCEWNATTNRCAAVVAQFTTQIGTGNEQVRYDATAQHYIVNWKTDQCVTGPCSLDPAKQYRLRVLVGAAELGFADVTVVPNASALKNTKTNETIALMDGRTLPIKVRIEQGAVAVLTGGAAITGTSGGSVTTDDGSAALTFPPAALSQPTPITITSTTDGDDFAPTVDLGPDGTQFAIPVTLTLPYEPSKLPLGVNPADLGVFTFDGQGWVEVPNVTVDEANATVSAPINHFSTYTLYARPTTSAWTPTPTTIGIGQTTVVSGSAWYYDVIPGRQYCYPVYSYNQIWGRWYRYVSGQYCYTTPSQPISYPMRSVGVVWSSSSPGVASVPPTLTYTDNNGQAQSPPILGVTPGVAHIRGTMLGVTSNAVAITVVGQLGLLPKTADVVAGWVVRQQVTQNVTLPYDVTFTMTSGNTLIVAEAGTSNYTYGGQTGSYVMPAGSTSKDLSIAGLDGPGVNTLIAAAPGYLPDTAVITLVKGKFLVNGWPSQLAVGDSAPLTLTVADVNDRLGSLAYPIDVALAPAGGIVFTDGQTAISTVRVQQRTSPTFYVKATTAGNASVIMTHRDYVDYTNTLTVNPPPIVGPQSVCNHTVTGIGFDGTYYYVAEGHDGLFQCISRFAASTGYLVDSKQVPVDHRGAHWVQSLGAVTSRTWGGPIFKIDYAAGTRTQIASNPTQSRPGDEQSQPAVDPDGTSYWILNNGHAERRRLSDHALLRMFPVTTTASVNVIAVSDQWVFVLDGAGANAYSKAGTGLAGRQPLPHPHPCNYYGFGVSANADRIMYLSDCRHVEVVPVTVTFTEPAPIIGPQSVCGRAITGIGYDGTYYYVAEGHESLFQCVSRFAASTGALVDTRRVAIDHRGLHWIQATGRITSRTWGGPIYAVDYATGNQTQLASNPTVSRPGDEQSAPAVDRDGQSYWILTNGIAERRRLSDHALLKSFAVTTTATNNVIAASDEWVFVLDGSGANAYSKVSGAFAGRQPLPHPHGCNYYGFGVSANADRIMYVSDCRHMEVVPVTVTFTDPPPQVAAAGKSNCAKRPDGSVTCWGEASFGATTPSPGSFSTIGAGFFHYCGIRPDQTLNCWGYNSDNRATPPSGTFKQISVASESNCAIRTDNTAACWGFSNDGRVSPPAGTYKQIGLGWYHGCGIRSDDTMVCWGRNDFGQSVAPAGTFLAVAGGSAHTCALRTDQTLTCFGNTPAPPSGTFTQVSASMGGHSCAIRSDRTLACWGQNDRGQVTPPAGQYLQVSAAWLHSCAVRTDRAVVCWGFNDTGALNVPAELSPP